MESSRKASTTIARSYDVIRIEDLQITSMTRSAAGTLDEPGKIVAAKRALNRSILAQGWGLFARRLEDKAAGRACGYNGNADVNAARNIAAGHAVKSRGGDRIIGPVKREPQDDLLLAS
jgi:transposase